MDIAERIKAVRGDLSQEEFAKALDIHKNSLGRYERGDSTPGVDVAEKICFVFGVSPQWLLLGKGSMRSDEAATQTQEADELKKRISELEAKNALLQELARTRQDALEDKKETLIAYRLMLNQAQSILTALEKEGVIIPGAPAYAPAAPSTDPTNEE